MVKYKKYKDLVFIFLILFFLLFSFYPTIFELFRSDQLSDVNREFILEHNYYWPDYNLYLSKIRQGFEGRITALERYTSEKHNGSLIQEFYVITGLLGRFLGLTPNLSYLLGRIILSPLLLLIILLLVRFYFRSFIWQILGFIIILVSGSYPRFYLDGQGVTQVGRYMEWWSNIDSLQRITFIPHILFGQVVSFFLLYRLLINRHNILSKKQIVLYIALGNAVGLVFPPSLITLNSVLFLIIAINLISKYRNFDFGFLISKQIPNILYLTLSSISLIYIFITTKFLPWSSLVDFHRTHPMMIPFWEYILGTGPVFYLGIIGGILTIFRRDRKFQPMIFWFMVTFSFAVLFSNIKEQSPLRFTQTGLFIPLGILGTYFFKQLFFITGDAREGFPARATARQSEGEHEMGNSSGRTRKIKLLLKIFFIFFITFYILENFYIMTVSLNWQTTWIAQRIRASYPLVPYPPQAMYPLTDWMNGIRWLEHNTKRSDVVIAEVTAGSYIPAYSGNTVFFGQANTVDYNKKEMLVDLFFKGGMDVDQASSFLKYEGIKYVFFSVAEKEKAGGGELHDIYPFLKSVYQNGVVTIYKIES